jgi:hypothetical protein
VSTSYDWARAVVTNLGGNPNGKMVRVVAIWARSESGSGGRSWDANNPLNIKGIGDAGSQYLNNPTAGRVGPFAVYSTPEKGAAATAALLNSNRGWDGYAPIVAAIRADDPAAFFSALFKSKWEETGYGTHGGAVKAGTSAANMVAAYNSGLAFNFQVNTATLASVPVNNAATDVNQWIAFFQAFPHGADTTWHEWLTADPSGFNIIGQYSTQILGALTALGIDPNSKMTDADIKRVADWLQAKGPAPAPGSKGLDINPLLAPMQALQHALENLLDPENWLYIFAIAFGVPLAWRGFQNISR